MTRMWKLSFISRIGICVLLSIVINILVGENLKNQLSQKTYSLLVDIDYPNDGDLELYYDSGIGFNQIQKTIRKVKAGRDTIQLPLDLGLNEQLKFLRLDFGSDNTIKNIVINSTELITNDKSLFKISFGEFKKNIVFSKHIEKVDDINSIFILDTSRSSFDPYIVFKPINELIYPTWSRTLLLILPWIILFILPIANWISRLNHKKEFVLIFVALFIATIPLKIAWVTFSTLLLLAYGLLNFYSKGRLNINSIQVSVFIFFIIPLLLMGDGNMSKLAIPMGFLLFPLIGTTIDFSKHTHDIKKIYLNIFLVLSSILIVSWSILILYNGYYYNINFSNYFNDIKTNAHASIYWLFYDHTTFLSFFILIGNVFCFDLLKNKQISKYYSSTYFILSVFAILLLGSRLAVILLLLQPVLFLLPLKSIYRLMLPTVIIVFSSIICFIGYLDGPRNQLWKMSWAAIQERPWAGHGTGTSEGILQNIELANMAGFNSVLKMNHSHNQYLTYLLENGIIGFLIFLLAFINIIYCYYKLDNKTMLILCFMILLLMLFESPFRTATPLYLISFLFSILSKKETHKKQKRIFNGNNPHI